MFVELDKFEYFANGDVKAVYLVIGDIGVSLIYLIGWIRTGLNAALFSLKRLSYWLIKMLIFK
jgi:hypothetical protein